MGDLWQDLKYGLRIHTKEAGFTILAILTLALGIGASISVFSVVNAILLKPLPYSEAGRIVVPWRLVPPGMNMGFNEIPWGMPHFQHLLAESKAFQHIGAFQSDSFNLTGSGDPALLEGMRVSSGFFHALGVQPEIGRTFTSEENVSGHHREVVLSHLLWRERFGGDSTVTGRVLELNGEPYTVIGVMPAGFAFPRAEEMPGSFQFPRQAQLWVPVIFPSAPLRGDEPDDLAIIGRLQPGMTIERAQAEMDLFAKHEDLQFPRARGWFTSRVVPLTRQVTGDTRQPLLLLMAAVGVVLLIACSNVASLLLIRSMGRRSEFTLRAALGAGRMRLVRQLLTESLPLAVAGGAGGLMLARAGISLVRSLGPASIPRLQEVGLDLRVGVFAVAVTFLTGIFFGMAPAIGATRHNLVESLKQAGPRSGGSAAGPRFRNALFISEVALALLLVIAAGLLVQTFFYLLRVDGGFQPEHVMTFELPLPASKYTSQSSMVALYHNVLQRLQTAPGVQSAGMAEVLPMGGSPESTMIRIPGHPQPGKERPFANYTIASPRYFEAAGIPLLRGREFSEADTGDSLPVAIISNAMARKYFPGEDALDKQVGLGSTRYPPMRIIGIVADIKHKSLREEPAPEMYVPYTQNPWPSMLMMQFAVRAKGSPESVLSGVRSEIAAVDKDLPFAKAATLTSLVEESMAQPKFAMLLLGAFAGMALIMATVCMYGTISYSVTQRTQELGLRMALGAQRGSVFALVLGHGARLAGAGVLAGLIAALLVTRLMKSFLFGVQATDPLTYVGVSLLLVVVALLACYLPARRAMRLDPITVLRYE